MSKRVLIAAAATAAVTTGNAVAEAEPTGTGSSADAAHAFVALDPLAVPIVDSGRIQGSLNVSLVLGASDETAADALRGRGPEIRSALLAATLEFSRLHASGLAPVDARLLQTQLAEALRRTGAGSSRLLVVEVRAEPA